MTTDPPALPVPGPATGIGDASRWGPTVRSVLARHGRGQAGRELVAGRNPTWPTFLCGDVVVKRFGGLPTWRLAHAAEASALRRVAADPELLAPRVLSAGRLSDDEAAPWPYLVTTCVRGRARDRDALTAGERRRVARELGEQVRRLHALPPDGAVSYADWSPPDVSAAAER